MLTYNYVPTCFSTGVIIPILKKATLDPNIPKNYRPITLSSIYSKLFEAVVMPDVDLNSNQFGFRKGCGTSFREGVARYVFTILVMSVYMPFYSGVAVTN